MADLVTTTSQGGKNAGSGRPRVTVTRSTARTARTGDDDAGREGVRLGIIFFATAAAIVCVILLGILGHQAGFAISIGVTDLQQSMADALVSGLLIPITLAIAIYETGIREPLLFTGALVVMLPPIAGLVAARPRRRGTMGTKPAVRIAAGIGAALILFADILLAVRTANSTRDAIIPPESFEPARINDWLVSLQTTAAMDAVAAVVAIMLAVLIFRLPTDRWVRGLVGTSALAAAVITTTAVAATGGTLHGYSRNRPVINEGGTTQLMIGSRPNGESVLLSRRSTGANLFVPVIRRLDEAQVMDRQSILSYLDANSD